VSNVLSMSPVAFGFVAALEREVSSLVQDWRTAQVGTADAPLTIHSDRNAALVCAGTGVSRAYAASMVLIEKCSPGMLISIGFAGSCVSNLHPGSIVVPATLLEAGTGRTFHCAFGRGHMVTLDRVAGKALKQEASARFGALAVDMEAAGVAAAAVECGRGFAAIKVISDGAQEDLRFLADFVKPEGFETGRFIAHIALRPGLWPSVATLNRNSKLATAVLESAVRECLSDGPAFSAKYSSVAAQV
jgi:adenosylhomocysteine nucleosidase